METQITHLPSPFMLPPLQKAPSTLPPSLLLKTTHSDLPHTLPDLYSFPSHLLRAQLLIRNPPLSPDPNPDPPLTQPAPPPPCLCSPLHLRFTCVPGLDAGLLPEGAAGLTG